MDKNRENPASNFQSGTGPSSESEVKPDPESRTAEDDKMIREKSLDKTLADSFPTSDPPSSIPDPGEDESNAA